MPKPSQSEMIPGSDWSMGLNSPTSVSHAKLLADLGSKLRNVYAELIESEMPEHLAELMTRLEVEQTDTRN
jgi:hypothetical protein